MCILFNKYIVIVKMNICVENIVFKTELPDKCAGLLEIYGVSIIRNRIEANIILPPPLPIP